MLMVLVQGPHFENHWNKLGISAVCINLPTTAMKKPGGLRGYSKPNMYLET